MASPSLPLNQRASSVEVASGPMISDAKAMNKAYITGTCQMAVTKDSNR
ncbi:MAG: hypothetical protein U5K56_04400 [Halioglobus sp.]|nr:hypothetical protein [Halioglobus sp.]